MVTKYISTTVKKDLDTIVKVIGLKEIQGQWQLTAEQCKNMS